MALAVLVVPTAPKPPIEPTYTCVMPPAQLPAAGECTENDELARATAVIHYFDNEVRYATASDPMTAKAQALLALPMMCNSSHYSYPALDKHIESAATIALERGDRQTARALIEVGRAYDVDARMLESLSSMIER